MTFDDRRWMQRVAHLGGPGYRFFVQRRVGVSMPFFRLYAALMTGHRWLWVRGFEV